MNCIPRARKPFLTAISHNYGFCAILANKASTATDPIQKLFLQMLKDYDQKSKSIPDRLVDPSPEIKKELKTEMDRITKIYGGDGKTVDMSKFPTFNFQDPVIDPINQAKEDKK